MWEETKKVPLAVELCLLLFMPVATLSAGILCWYRLRDRVAAGVLRWPSGVSLCAVALLAAALLAYLLTLGIYSVLAELFGKQQSWDLALLYLFQLSSVLTFAVGLLFLVFASFSLFHAGK